MRAMRCVGSPVVSVPWTLIEPRRRPIRPRMARSVLVRPAPFLPSSVTTSPSSTWKSTPCRTCDSPYQPCRFETSRKRFAISVGSDQLGLGAAHVRLDDRGVLRDLGVGTFGERRAAREDGDR